MLFKEVATIGNEMEIKIKAKAKEELAKLEVMRNKKVVKMKKIIAENIKKEGEQQQRAARARDPTKKSASKSLSRKRVDAKKEEKDSLAPKDLPQAESSKHVPEPPKILEQPPAIITPKTKAKFKDFSQFEKLDKNVIQSAIKDVVKDSQQQDKELPKSLNGKRIKNFNPNLEQKFRNLSIESEEAPNEKVVATGNARQKIDQEGNSIKIEKKIT